MAMKLRLIVLLALTSSACATIEEPPGAPFITVPVNAIVGAELPDADTIVVHSSGQEAKPYVLHVQTSSATDSLLFECRGTASVHGPVVHLECYLQKYGRRCIAYLGCYGATSSIRPSTRNTVPKPEQLFLDSLTVVIPAEHLYVVQSEN